MLIDQQTSTIYHGILFNLDIISKEKKEKKKDTQQVRVETILFIVISLRVTQRCVIA